MTLETNLSKLLNWWHLKTTGLYQCLGTYVAASFAKVIDVYNVMVSVRESDLVAASVKFHWINE